MDSIAAASRRTSRPYLTAFSIFIVSCFFAIIVQVLFFSPITPDPLDLPPSSSASLLPTNSQLQRVIKLGEGLLNKPEDQCVDKNGILYTATRDGWIKRLHRNGSWEDWMRIKSDTLLGLTVTKQGSIIVCDAEKGLLKFGEDGVTVLASHVNGTKINLADDVIEAPDGNLYFSVASTKFGLHNWYFDVLEAKPHGQLLKYDPALNETSIVLDDLCFANGIALSADQEYLVVCETWKFRCLKYWLSGESKGKTEIFVDHFGSLFFRGLESVHTSKALKHLVATFPRLLKLVIGTHEKATVVNVATDGKIIKSFDDPDGEVMSFVTSALEFENHLYLGSLNSNFIGKLPLNVA